MSLVPDRREAEGVRGLYGQYRPEDGEERMRVVASLALVLQEAGYKESKRSAIVRSWEEMAELLPAEWPRLRREGFLSWLAGSGGLLSDRTDGTLAFAHLSFQEFLSAWQLNATVDGKEERIAVFRRYVGDASWQETLLLWAALIGRGSQERVAQILLALMEDDEDGVAFAGLALADGLGTTVAVDRWQAAMMHQFSRSWRSWMDACGEAWKKSRQEERKKTLANAMAQGATTHRWPARILIAQFLDACGEEPLLAPASGLARDLEQIQGALSESGLAVGRILCGYAPLWPLDPIDVGYLHLWPGRRRVIGLRLQSAALAGASYAELAHLVGRWSSESGSGERSVMREIRRNVGWGLERVVGKYFGRYIGRYVGQDLEQNVIRWAEIYFEQYFERYILEILRMDYESDVALDVRGCLGHYVRRFFDGHFWQDGERYFKQGFRFQLIKNCKKDLGFEEAPPWMESFAVLDLINVGRDIAQLKAALYHIDNLPPLGRFMKVAARHSLDEKPLPEDAIPEDLPHPDLFVALAKHLCRCASSEDRALLISLAQDPMRSCPAPLSWGLRYIVRGDIRLDDGSIVTLDQLTQDAGVPPLPYLEDLPPEVRF